MKRVLILVPLVRYLAALASNEHPLRQLYQMEISTNNNHIESKLWTPGSRVQRRNHPLEGSLSEVSHQHAGGSHSEASYQHMNAILQAAGGRFLFGDETSDYINALLVPKDGKVPVDVKCLAAQGIVNVPKLLPSNNQDSSKPIVGVPSNLDRRSASLDKYKDFHASAIDS
ncbi:hypothetical protein KSP40_PGU014561 [Platanthera guangdongensis]|uniref:Uncharacterized protein n=1 Tax=Platanthera guangdongensis TaxID=2320717 RepID=A0ABR2M5F9_9ASPA